MKGNNLTSHARDHFAGVPFVGGVTLHLNQAECRWNDGGVVSSVPCSISMVRLPKASLLDFGVHSP